MNNLNNIIFNYPYWFKTAELLIVKEYYDYYKERKMLSSRPLGRIFTRIKRLKAEISSLKQGIYDIESIAKDNKVKDIAESRGTIYAEHIVTKILEDKY